MDKNNKKNSKQYPKEVRVYLKELSQLPTLGIEEEKKLFKKIEREDDNARDAIYKSYLGFVVKIAEYYLPQAKNLTLLDLIQEGNLGLFQAAKLYDWRSNYKFSTFATLLIRKSILRAIEDLERSILPKDRKTPKKTPYIYTLETPFYQNIKGEAVPWEKLTEEDRKEIKRKDRAKMKYELKKKFQKDNSEIIKLISSIIGVSKLEAKKEIEKF